MNNLNNMNKKKNWNQKFLTNMKYQSFKRKNYYIDTLDKNSKELYIIDYDTDKKEGFIPNTLYLYNKVKHLKNIEERIQKFNDYYIDNYIFDSTQTIDSKGWSVFDSLIHLRQNLSYSINISESSVSEADLLELENNLSVSDRKKIIKWCQKYGMPFLGDKSENTKADIRIDPFLYGFKNDIYTCISKDVCACRLSTFLIALNILFRTLYFYLVYLIDQRKVDTLKINIPHSYYENYNYNDIENYIKRAFYSISDKSIINLDTIFSENGLPKFENYAETIISLAMYQLAVIISTKKIYDISECKACEEIYIPTRKSREYCMSCDRHTKTKKEELANGKHNKKKK